MINYLWTCCAIVCYNSGLADDPISKYVLNYKKWLPTIFERVNRGKMVIFNLER